MMKVNLARYSNNFYKYGTDGKPVYAWHNISRFFEEAEGTNSSVARMHLRYSQVSADDGNLREYLGEKIKEESYKKKSSNIVKLAKQLSKDGRYKELNGLIKEMYAKTYKKRIAILNNLNDSEVYGLSEVSEAKFEKIKDYLMLKLQFWK